MLCNLVYWILVCVYRFLKLKADKMLSSQLFQSVAKLRTWYS